MANNFDTLLTAAPGSVVTLEPDYIVVNDGVSYLAAVEAKSVANPDKVLVFFDHNVPTGDPEGARVFGVIRDFAKKFGCRFIQAQGVAYQSMSSPARLWSAAAATAPSSAQTVRSASTSARWSWPACWKPANIS